LKIAVNAYPSVRKSTIQNSTGPEQMYGLNGRLAGMFGQIFSGISSSKFGSVSSWNSEYTSAVILICSERKCDAIIILSIVPIHTLTLYCP